ncbi:transposase [Algoriphagus halophilus]|uniref:transposase n=1 Tax=Algoriphagus halophilus TaxID=226505 RepID=UPI0035901568
MKKSRFTETQIVKAIKAHEAGRKVEEICREMEVTPATFYKWKQRYGGMEASEVKKLKELQEENSRLKRMFADLSLCMRLSRMRWQKALTPDEKACWFSSWSNME